MNRWLICFLVILFSLIFIITIISWFQSQILFYPNTLIVSKPKLPYRQVKIKSLASNLPRIEIIEDDADINSKTNHTSHHSQYINLWHFNNHSNKAKTVLFCHGNTGNISHRSYIIDLCHHFKLNLVLFDYRGYGSSIGMLNQKTICEDGVHAYHYLLNYCSPDQIIIWGESLGGSVASYIASKHPCSHLILMCTFSSLDDILIYSGIITRPIANLLSLLFDMLPSKNRIIDVKTPTVIIHSHEDELIPFECANVMYRRIGHSNKVLIPVKGQHASPLIDLSQILTLFDFCGIPYTCSDFEFLYSWIDNLQSLGQYCRA